MTSDIQNFYSKIQFPGHYTTQGLQYHTPVIRNKYLAEIDTALGDNLDILDVGCGTGLITNLFAQRYPSSRFTAIDFSDSVDYGQQFATDNNITNTSFKKVDFMKFESDQQYDVVISQGVLHHIPNYDLAFSKIMSLVKPNGYLVVGLYHPWGKLAKKIMSVNYQNDILYLDQEENPFETSFSVSQVKSIFSGYKLVSAYPSAINIVTAIHALFNYKNGGLATYVFQNFKEQ